MSPQILEIVIFAAIAYFIINKLISILGSTDEDSPKHRGSKYGEPTNLKEVRGFDISNIKAKSIKNLAISQKQDYSFLINSKDRHLAESLEELTTRIENFNPASFIKNASKATEFILEALQNNDQETLEELVDSRYLSDVIAQKEKYNSFSKNISDAKISDITFFGNNVIIKIVVSPTKKLLEEWAFSKKLNLNTQTWLLSNIESYVQ